MKLLQKGGHSGMGDPLKVSLWANYEVDFHKLIGKMCIFP